MTSKKTFGYESTAEEVAEGFDLSGKVAIVTGGYSGIGLETARVLAIHGAHVFVIGRDMNKCTQEVNRLKDSTGKQSITAMHMDLSSFASIRNFVEEFNRLNIPVHLLINNAGVMCCPQAKTTDGLEYQFGTNHVGHFLLTLLLIPRLTDGAPSRVVTLSSTASYLTGIRWDDINFEKSNYGRWLAYGQSKSANALFSQELNRLYRDRGITSNAVHPGIINTELGRHGTITWEFFKFMPKWIASMKLGKMKEKTIPQGAATTLYAALLPETAEGGKMYGDCSERPPPAHACDPAEATKLWEYTARLVGM